MESSHLSAEDQIWATNRASLPQGGSLGFGLRTMGHVRKRLNPLEFFINFGRLLFSSCIRNSLENCVGCNVAVISRTNGYVLPLFKMLINIVHTHTHN